MPYNEARYGRSNGSPCSGNVCSNTWELVRDAANQWYADQRAAGRSEADVNAELRTFDQWDRYDFDNDGNFNEPDGYLDHFQIVHAGGDQADADPNQGEDAIWSHRWKTFQTPGTGPANNQDGGNQIGTSGIWIADYTIQPENGGRSVFFHEFGHDLGLPDDYDTSGAGDNPNEYWTLMAQSRLGAKNEPFIGDRAGDLGAWNKLQLGWLDYEIAPAGQKRTFQLGPEEYNSDKAQALVVSLPAKSVVTELGAPFAGSYQWWSGAGDDLSNTMSRQVTLPAGSATLAFQARWNIEDCGPDPCDYAYVEVDDGTGWLAIPGSVARPAEGNGIDGVTDGWRAATFDLSAYAGKSIGLRFRYTTDGAARGTDPNRVSGLFVDDLTITAGGQTLLTDGAETTKRVDPERLHRGRQASYTTAYPQLLHRRLPQLRLLRQVPQDRSVQLRFPASQTRLGGALPVSDRIADLVLGHVAAGQQRLGTSGTGPEPVRRCAPADDLPARRQAVANPGPDLRRAVQHPKGRFVHAAPQQPGQLHPRAGRATDVRRHQELVRPESDRPRGQGRQRRSQDHRAVRERDDGQDQARHDEMISG